MKTHAREADEATNAKYDQLTLLAIDYPESVNVNWLVHCLNQLRDPGNSPKAMGSPELILEFEEKSGVSPDEIVTFFMDHLFQVLAQDDDFRSLLTWINSEQSRITGTRILAALSELHKASVSPGMNTTIPKRITTKLPIISPDHIVGRQTDLQDLHDRLFANRQVVLVNGLGGIGKTTLAQAYVGKYLEEYHYLAWFSLITGDIPQRYYQCRGCFGKFRHQRRRKRPPNPFY